LRENKVDNNVVELNALRKANVELMNNKQRGNDVEIKKLNERLSRYKKEIESLKGKKVDNNKVEPLMGQLDKYKIKLSNKEGELSLEKNNNKGLEKQMSDCNNKMKNLEEANRNSGKNNRILLDNNKINRANNNKLLVENKRISLELYKIKFKRSNTRKKKKKSGKKKSGKKKSGKKESGKKKKTSKNGGRITNSINKEEFNEMINYYN
jgi:hypothetical protein